MKRSSRFRTWMGQVMALSLGVASAWTAGLPSPSPDGKRLPGLYSTTRVGLLPVTAAEGRALIHTEQCLAFAGDPVELEGADIVAQTQAIVRELDEELRHFRSGLEQSMRVHICIKRAKDRAAVQAVISEYLKGGVPAMSFVVGDLPVASALVGIDVVGYTGYTTASYADGRRPVVSSRKGIWGARNAFLPAGQSIFISGQAVRGEDPADSARKTLDQLGKTLGFLERGWTNVVQIKTFLRNPVENAAGVSRAIATCFKPKGHVPPQVYVEWISANDLEIELVVDGGPAKPDRPRIEFLTPPFMKQSPAFSRVVRVNHGRLVYTSGIAGPGGDQALDQAKAIFGEIDTTMAVFRVDMKNLVKGTYYVGDAAAGEALNEVRSMLFDPKRPPAASKALVKGIGLPGSTMAVDMIGVAAAQ